MKLPMLPALLAVLIPLAGAAAAASPAIIGNDIRADDSDLDDANISDIERIGWHFKRDMRRMANQDSERIGFELPRGMRCVWAGGRAQMCVLPRAVSCVADGNCIARR